MRNFKAGRTRNRKKSRGKRTRRKGIRETPVTATKPPRNLTRNRNPEPGQMS